MFLFDKMLYITFYLLTKTQFEKLLKMNDELTGNFLTFQLILQYSILFFFVLHSILKHSIFFYNEHNFLKSKNQMNMKFRSSTIELEKQFVLFEKKNIKIRIFNLNIKC